MYIEKVRRLPVEKVPCMCMHVHAYACICLQKHAYACKRMHIRAARPHPNHRGAGHMIIVSWGMGGSNPHPYIYIYIYVYIYIRGRPYYMLRPALIMYNLILSAIRCNLA